MAGIAITPNAHTVLRRKPVKRVGFLTFREQGKKMSITGLEISKMLTLSTAHITKETSCLLEDWAASESSMPLIVWNYGYGWIIQILDDEDENEEISQIPEEIQVIRLFCLDHDIDFIRFDRDAFTTELFDTFEW